MIRGGKSIKKFRAGGTRLNFIHMSSNISYNENTTGIPLKKNSILKILLLVSTSLIFVALFLFYVYNTELATTNIILTNINITLPDMLVCDSAAVPSELELVDYNLFKELILLFSVL